MSGDLSKFVQISYHPLAFVSSALPVAPVDAGTIWAKRSGNFSLTLSPIAVITSKGLDNTLPYGKTARAILHYLVTEARRRNSRFITLPSSQSELLRELGLAKNARQSQEVADQLIKVLSMAVGLNLEEAKKLKDGQPTSQHLLGQMFTVGKGYQLNLDAETKTIGPGSTIELSEAFMENMVNDSIFPVDNEQWRALMAATKSSMALDIYLWLAYRLPNLRDDVHLSWETLQDQFGSQIKDSRGFRRKFLEALAVVKEYYPQANIEEVGKGERQGFRGVKISRSVPALKRDAAKKALQAQDAADVE